MVTVETLLRTFIHWLLITMKRLFGGMEQKYPKFIKYHDSYNDFLPYFWHNNGHGGERSDEKQVMWTCESRPPVKTCMLSLYCRNRNHTRTSLLFALTSWKNIRKRVISNCLQGCKCAWVRQRVIKFVKSRRVIILSRCWSWAGMETQCTETWPRMTSLTVSRSIAFHSGISECLSSPQTPFGQDSLHCCRGHPLNVTFSRLSISDFCALGASDYQNII